MDSPILTPVSWAKGKYDSYSLHPNGTLVGSINPPGLAHRVNKDPRLTVDDNILFLLSQNQRCKGKWFISAMLEQQYHSCWSGELFHCHLILVMGGKSLAKSLMDPEITVFYYKFCNNLGQLSISEMINTYRNPEEFICKLFHPTLEQSSGSKLCIRYPNQISGLTFTCWDLYPSIEIVDGVEYHQCRLGPDQWSNRTKIFKELEAEVSLTNPQYDTWKHHNDHYIESCHDKVAQLCLSQKLSQFHGSRVLVTYSLLQKAYGKYMRMPMPRSTPCGQYFGLITKEQKQMIDSEFTEDINLMDPKEFTDMVLSMTLENGFDTLVCLKGLSCSSQDSGNRHMSFIVSIVSLETHNRLSEKNTVVKSDECSHQLVEMLDVNIQDPYMEGTVVFRRQVFLRVYKFGMNEMAMVIASYPKSFQRHRTDNAGTFHMIQERQSNMSSQSMGVCGNRTKHHYYNKSSTNTSLVPLTSSFMNMLNYTT